MILKEKWPQSFVIRPLKRTGKVKCGFFYQNGRSENFEFNLSRLSKAPIMKIGGKEAVASAREIDDFSIFREIIKSGAVDGFHDVSTEKITSKIIKREKYSYRILKILTDFSSSRIFIFELNKSVNDIDLKIQPESVNEIRSSIVVKGKNTSLLIVATNLKTGAKEVLSALL